MSTLCDKHFEPLLKEGSEPEIFSMWPLSPCVICGEWPMGYHEAMAAGRRWYAVQESTVERVRKLIVLGGDRSAET